MFSDIFLYEKQQSDIFFYSFLKPRKEKKIIFAVNKM